MHWKAIEEVFDLAGKTATSTLDLPVSTTRHWKAVHSSPGTGVPSLAHPQHKPTPLRVPDTEQTQHHATTNARHSASVGSGKHFSTYNITRCGTYRQHFVTDINSTEGHVLYVETNPQIEHRCRIQLAVSPNQIIQLRISACYQTRIEVTEIFHKERICILKTMCGEEVSMPDVFSLNSTALVHALPILPHSETTKLPTLSLYYFGTNQSAKPSLEIVELSRDAGKFVIPFSFSLCLPLDVSVFLNVSLCLCLSVSRSL